jgi:hypothetical protein
MMDVATLYSLRSETVPLCEATIAAIAKMRRTPVSYKPAAHVHGRRYQRKTTPRGLPENWREKAILETHRRLKEREDPDYDVVVTSVNKLSNEHFDVMVRDTLEVLEKRDDAFRLRVSTLVFDRGILQNFFAPLIAKFIKVLSLKFPEMRDDIAVQISMFHRLYDADNITLVPSSNDPTYDDAIIAWTKQKEKKRGFAVMVGELNANGMVHFETMRSMLQEVINDLDSTSREPKTPATEEHVDHLVRFLFAVAPNVKGQMIDPIKNIMEIPRPHVPSLTMKSRFKLEDALKILKSPSV